MTINNIDPVFSIQQGDYIAPIGAKSDNIFITDINGQIICSLTDFFNEWQSFKQDGRFLQYGTVTPDSSRVKLWYQTTINTEEDDVLPIFPTAIINIPENSQWIINAISGDYLYYFKDFEEPVINPAEGLASNYIIGYLLLDELNDEWHFSDDFIISSDNDDSILWPSFNYESILQIKASDPLHQIYTGIIVDNNNNMIIKGIAIMIVGQTTIDSTITTTLNEIKIYSQKTL